MNTSKTLSVPQYSCLFQKEFGNNIYTKEMLIKRKVLHLEDFENNTTRAPTHLKQQEVTGSNNPSFSCFIITAGFV